MSKTKEAIIERLHTERRRLEQNLAGLSPEEMTQPGVVGDWSVKDVLAHLADWEQMCLGWCAVCDRGEKPETPAPGLTWSQLDILNQRIYERYRDWSLDQVRALFDVTHREFMAMVEGLAEDKLLTPGLYSFTERRALADWMGHYARHDEWGKDEIRKWRKMRAG